MISLRVKISGATEIVKAITDLDNAMMSLAYKVFKEEMDIAHELVVSYPPERPGQKYKRTGTYGETTNLVSSPFSRGGGTISIVSDAVDPYGTLYSPFVGGNQQGKGQSWFHVNRWAVTYNEVVEAAKRALYKLDREIISTAISFGLNATDKPGEVDAGGLERQ